MINTVVITGRLTTDPELKTTDNGGKKVCNFTIAINDGYGDKQKSYFIACVVWNKSAENLVQYTKKGDLIGVEGKLTQRTFDLNGSIRSVTEVLCSSVTFLNSTNTKTSPTANESTQPTKYSSYYQTEPQHDKKVSSVDNNNNYETTMLDYPQKEITKQDIDDYEDLPF